ncbi:MAG: fibrobacter succinogenes major paralogous domain-containing protein [Bacteroidales bacterium]|nr:fibrobacter succinogenes major paralogous domain-containing protein [Bacteroidales bacterium]
MNTGLTASYGSSVVAAQSPVTGNTITNVNAVISGLNAGTTYHYRVKAVNTLGTTNGNDVTFTTLNYPTVSTATITNLTTNSATSGGNITSNGGSAVTARGVCWSISANPTTALATKTVDGSGSGVFTSSITGLAPGTAYHVRAYATNSVGTAYGNDITLTTTPAGSVPVVTTTAITLITLNSAISGGNVTSDGGATITARGVVWSTTTAPTIALATKTAETGTTGSFVSSVTGLTAATTYFLRAYATNSIGTSYGAEMSFVTQSSGSVTDRENNVYNTITIGTQRWMTENLKVTTFNDGTLIPNVSDQSAWGILTTPAYCWYNNDILLKDTYGALYSWFAVDNASNGGRNVCPVGWHVSSDAEWNTLAQYLTDNGFGYGGSGNDIAKSLAANAGWNISAIEGGAGFNQANNNSSGFSAVPAGVRDATQFQLAGSLTRWWVPAGSDPDVSWIRQIQSDDSLIPRSTNTHEFGYAIRCIEGLIQQRVIEEFTLKGKRSGKNPDFCFLSVHG